MAKINDNVFANLSICNYQKNMILTTSAVNNSNCCLNYWSERCRTCYKITTIHTLA